MMQLFFKTLIYSIVFSLVSCNFLYKHEERKAVARVGDNFLYEEDIKNIISENSDEKDSADLVRHYIRDWMTKQLLMDNAIVNLNEEKIRALEVLVKDYRTDLYTNAYQEALISRVMDTTVYQDEIEAFYDQNNENFRLNEELLKLRYIHLTKDNSNLDHIVELFKRFNDEDKNKLDSLGIQFKRYSLNDSIWIKITQVIDKIPVVTLDTKKEYLKKNQFFQIQDSLEVYLIYIKAVAKTYDIAPLSYIEPTIKQVILNKRKLEFIRKIEKDIVDDAVQKKQFEFYE